MASPLLRQFGPTAGLDISAGAQTVAAANYTVRRDGIVHAYVRLSGLNAASTTYTFRLDLYSSGGTLIAVGTANSITKALNDTVMGRYTAHANAPFAKAGEVIKVVVSQGHANDTNVTYTIQYLDPQAVDTGEVLEKTIYVDPAGNDSNSGGSPGAPLLTIAAAIALAATGDTIQLAPGTYAQGTTRTILASGVSLRGAGLSKSVITYTTTLLTDGPGLVPGTGSVIEDLTVDTSATADSTPFGVYNDGAGHTDTMPTRFTVRRCRFKGDIDGIFFSGVSAGVGYFYDCYFSSLEDCVAVGASGAASEGLGHRIYLFNCVSEALGPKTAVHSRAINANSKAEVNCYECDFHAQYAATTTYGVYASGAAVIRLFRCGIGVRPVTGRVGYSLFTTGTGSRIEDIGSSYDPGKTSGDGIIRTPNVANRGFFPPS